MHLYVHVPFCARRCSYCDFAIAVRRTVPSARFTDAVLAEWRGWLAHEGWGAHPGLHTLYFGGGTPSRLDPGELARLVERLAQDRPLVRGAEVTLEANPDDVTPDRARAWRAAGVTRISLGVQSFDPRVLAWMHRTHEAAQVGPAVDALRRAGFDDLSLDLIFALPEALGRDWADDLGRALALEPTHLSLYGLTVEPGTPLGRWTERGAAHPPADERYAAEYVAAHAALGAAGFEHYEVSNAARPGYRAVHNSAYWARAPFIGLGPSAHSGLGRWRAWNVAPWAAYERAALAGTAVRAGEEWLDEAQVRLERRYLGLRTVEGLAEDEAGPDAGRWVAEGWAVREAGRVRLTVEGWLRLDALAAAGG